MKNVSISNFTRSFRFLIFLSFFALDIGAQTDDCYTPSGCNDISIELIELMPQNDDYCLDDKDACGKRVFGIYLIIKPDMKPDFPINLNYVSLDFLAAITQPGNPDEQFDGQTEFDVDLTLGCNQENMFTGNVIIDPKSVNFHLEANHQINPWDDCLGIMNPVVLTSQATLIGTIVLDAYPGEEFAIDASQGNIEFYTNSGSQMNCGGNGTIIDPVSEPPAPTPSTPSNSNLQLVFEQVDDCEVVVKVLNLGSSSVTVDALDFEVLMDATNAMEAPTFFVPFPGSEVNLVSNGGNSFSMFADFETGFGVPGMGEQILFTFAYNAPINTSLFTEVTFSFGNLTRVKTEEECSSISVSSDNVICTHYGSQPCDDLPIEFSVLPKTVTTTCDELEVLIGISPKVAPVTIDITDIMLELEFVTSQGVTLSSSNIVGWPLFPPIENEINGNTYKYHAGGGLTTEFSFDDLTDTYYILLKFGSSNRGCITDVIIRQAMISIGPDICVPDVIIGNDFPTCVPEIVTHVKNPNDVYIDDGLVTYSASCDYNSGETDCAPFALCLNCNPNEVVVSAEKQDDWLNGMNSFDLWKLSKIINNTFTNSAPQYIAADVDGYNGLDEDDKNYMVRIMLGLDNPTGSPWLFVDPSSLPVQPFFQLSSQISYSTTSTVFPNQQSNPMGETELLGIKRGDLDNNASIGCQRPVLPTESVSFTPSLHKLQNQESYYELDFRYNSTTKIVAIQLDGQIDFGDYEYIQMDKGDVDFVNESNFNLTEIEEGIFRFIWTGIPNTEFERLNEGDILFRVILRKKESGTKPPELVLNQEKNGFLSASFTEDGLAFNVEMAKNSQTRTISENYEKALRVFPNPSSSEVQVQFELKSDSKVRVYLFSSFGKLVSVQKLDLSSGKQRLPIQGFEALSSGVYTLVVSSGEGTFKEKIIKQ